MSRFLFDCETDGLLDALTVVHCLVLKNPDTGEVFSFKPDAIEAGLRMLMGADEVIGHNIIKFDNPALAKVFPWFRIAPRKATDTLVLARLIWADLKLRDAALTKAKKFPGGKMTGSQSLEAWGHRLGIHKGEYTKWCEENGIEDPWAQWRPEMQTYCEQDVEVTEALWVRIVKKAYSPQAIELEHETAELCAQIERNGFPFDTRKAGELYATLVAKRTELEHRLKDTFKPWWVSEGVQTPKRTVNRKRPDLGTVLVRKGKRVKNRVEELWVEEAVTETVHEGVPYSKVKLQEFNPASRFHIADRLKAYHGWVPKEFTPSGEPKLDDKVLGDLPYPEAQLLATYMLVQKRIGQLAEGDQAWMKLERNGRIHGSYNPNGAVTGRSTHMWPNIAQVPAVKVGDDKAILWGLEGGYGAECRSLFGVPAGWVLVGADMSGLELRCLGHFMAKYDDGAYIEVVLNGDIHTVNQLAAGLPTRAAAKRFIYAYLYGAGDELIGDLVAPTASPAEKAKIGKKIKREFLSKTPALKKLKEAIGKSVERGFLVGLDKRLLHCRSEHSALNLLLQSAGALCCKRWITYVDQRLRSMGLKHGWDGDYAVLAWIHDEIQVACRNQEVAEIVGKICVEEAKRAGDFFNFRCPLTGEFKIGKTWFDTH